MFHGNLCAPPYKHRTGPASEVLSIVERPRPEPDAGEVYFVADGEHWRQSLQT